MVIFLFLKDFVNLYHIYLDKLQMIFQINLFNYKNKSVFALK